MKIWNIRNLKNYVVFASIIQFSEAKSLNPSLASKGSIFFAIFFSILLNMHFRTVQIMHRIAQIITSFTFSCTFSLLAPIQFLQLELCNKMLPATSLVLKNLICLQSRDVHCTPDGEGSFFHGAGRGTYCVIVQQLVEIICYSRGNLDLPNILNIQNHDHTHSSVLSLFHYGFPELERSKRVTFMLP